MMGAWCLKHVEWLCRNKICTVLHQVGVLFDLYYDARKHKSKIWISVTFKTHCSSHNQSSVTFGAWHQVPQFCQIFWYIYQPFRQHQSLSVNFLLFWLSLKTNKHARFNVAEYLHLLECYCRHETASQPWRLEYSTKTHICMFYH